MSAGYKSYTGTQQDVIHEAAHVATDDGLVYVPPGMKIHGSGVPMPAPTLVRLSPEIDAFWLQNNTGSADGVIGPGIRYKKSSWIAGSWTVSGSVFAINGDLQDRTAVTMDFSTDLDGLMIGCTEPFGWFNMNVTTASVGNAVTVMNYWDVNGAWVAPAATAVKGGALNDMILATGVWAVGEQSYAWDPAQDWGKVGQSYSAAPEGLASPSTTAPAGYYYMKFIGSGDPIETTQPVITGIEIGSHLLEENVDDESTVSRGPNLNYYSAIGDAVVMLSSVAVPGTPVNIAYQVSAKARG